MESDNAKRKFVRWVFTSFDMDCKPKFIEEKMLCMVYQKEQCPTTKRYHWQGAFQLRNQNGMQMKSVKNLFYDKGVHLEPMNGTWDQSSDYCSKEDTKVEGPWRFGKEPKPMKKAASMEKKRKFEEMMDDIKSGMTKKMIVDKHTDAYIRNHNAVDKVFDMFAPKPTNKKWEMIDFNVVPLRWNEIKVNFNTQCVVIMGPSGIGKTQWALANFKNPLDCRHIEDLRSLDESNDGIVFNDMDFRHWPRTAQIQLLDWDCHRPLHARYNNLRIPAGMRMIFTTNEECFTKDPAIDRRYVLREVNEPMFSKMDWTQVFEEEAQDQDEVEIISNLKNN